MAVALTGGFFKLDATQKFFEVDPEYIKTELGVALRAKQDINTALSIKEPALFITHRNSKIQNLFDAGTIDAVSKVFTVTGAGQGIVSEAFKKKVDELTKLSLPSDVVKSMATSHAARVYQEHIELLELESPDGYKRAFGIATADREAADAKNNLANTGISSYNSIAEYKAYKKAKKAAKKKAA
jgi:hypothetical protein